MTAPVCETVTVPLEPCPFCGATNAYTERADFSGSFAVCNECQARGPVTCDENDDDAEASEAGDCEPGELPARRLWNRRPAPRPSAAPEGSEREALIADLEALLAAEPVFVVGHPIQRAILALRSDTPAPQSATGQDEVEPWYGDRDPHEVDQAYGEYDGSECELCGRERVMIGGATGKRICEKCGHYQQDEVERLREALSASDRALVVSQLRGLGDRIDAALLQNSWPTLDDLDALEAVADWWDGHKAALRKQGGEASGEVSRG